MARLDNLFGSSWFNVKLGKFELDNLISEKRILTLTTYPGSTRPITSCRWAMATSSGRSATTSLGVEWMGHSVNDRTRVSAALLSSSDGNVNLPSGNATAVSLPQARPSMWAN